MLLLLHGTGAATHSWRALAPLLAEHFTVVAPDLPGHGFTTGRPLGGLAMPAMARAVGDLLTALDVRADAIVGHSAGAAIAVRMAIDGVAAPAASSGSTPRCCRFRGWRARLFPTLARLLFVNPFAPHLFARMARTPGETARFLARSTGSRIDAEGVRCYERLFATPAHCAGAITMMADWDLDALKRDLPRLGVAAAADPRRRAMPRSRSPPRARRRRWSATRGWRRSPALGHLAHEEQPGEVAALIARLCGGAAMDGAISACSTWRSPACPRSPFGIWQLVSINREIAKDRRKRDLPEGAGHPIGEHRLDDR